MTFTSENFKDANEDDCQDMNVMVAFMAIPTNPQDDIEDTCEFRGFKLLKNDASNIAFNEEN